VTAIGLDRSLLALGVARSLGLRHWMHADVCSSPLPRARTALLLDGNLGLAGTPAGAAPASPDCSLWAGRMTAGERTRPRHARLRPMVLRDEYRDRVGPWGRWLQAGLPAVLDLAHPAGWRLQYAATAGADYWAALSLEAS
jgi:hypothetical protein